MSKHNVTGADMLTDEVVVDLNVLCSRMKDQILGYCNDGSVVAVDNGGEGCGRLSSAARRRSQIASEVAAESDLYSTSVEDLATVACFFTVQAMRFGPRKEQNT